MQTPLITALIVVLGFIVSILVHAITVAYWAGRINTSVATLNEVLKEHKKMFDRLWAKHDDLNVRVTKLEAKR